MRLDGLDGSYSKLGSYSFASNTERCASAIVSAGTAGPETYDQAQHSITRMLAGNVNPRSPPFGTGQRRM